ncbi:MAG TPA: hypothetical protein VGG28_12415 [Kofleriaceae bacterium]
MSDAPTQTIELLGRGRDLRIPDDDYEFSPLSEALQYDEIASSLDDSRDGFVFERVTTCPGWVNRETIIALRVAGPWSILEHAGERTGVVASEHAGRWYVAFEATYGATLRTTFALGDGDAWHGDSWKLLPHPFVEPTARDWRWRNNSFGPHSITVVADGDLARFWAGCEPVVYGPDDGVSGIARDGQFVIHGDRFSIWRGYHDNFERAAFDAGVLLALARGAAGRVRWWLAMEHDWYAPFGIGDDGDSLVDYLLGDRAQVGDALDATLALVQIDASGDDVAATIAVGLGHEPIADAYFDSWLAAQPVTALPRHVSVALSREVYSAWHDRLNKLQPFVVWRVVGSG